VRRALAAAGAVAALAGASTAGPAHAQAGLPHTRHVLLGHSTEGRAIRAVRIGDLDSPRKALVVGSIHGDEPAGMRVTRALRELGGAAGVDRWVVDTVNPDGRARGTRRTARGVDLNRNFPYRWRRSARGSRYHSGSRRLSERESRIVVRWVERIRPAVTVWYHQPWGVVLLPCTGPAPVERRYVEVSRLPGERCRGADLTGTATSWQNHTFPGTRAFVVELPASGVSARAAGRHARAARAVAAG
jgi:protein MpaA